MRLLTTERLYDSLAHAFWFGCAVGLIAGAGIMFASLLIGGVFR